uniref:Metallothionein 4 n=1 Tax=Rousettus aegyptiacus TaxID=9407 RepID=A0A7J8CJL4_ROUAE|nr:metallothionein 4 [Rousettus aegyptiacus]
MEQPELEPHAKDCSPRSSLCSLLLECERLMKYSLSIRDSTGVPQTPGPWTPGNAPACLEESASVETTANAQLATVKHAEKAAAPAARRAVPSAPGAASAKGAQTSAAAASETRPLCRGGGAWEASVQSVG